MTLSFHRLWDRHAEKSHAVISVFDRGFQDLTAANVDSCGMLLSAVHKEGEEEKLHLLMVDPHIPAGAKLY